MHGTHAFASPFDEFINDGKKEKQKKREKKNRGRESETHTHAQSTDIQITTSKAIINQLYIILRIPALNGE